MNSFSKKNPPRLRKSQKYKRDSVQEVIQPGIYNMMQYLYDIENSFFRANPYYMLSGYKAKNKEDLYDKIKK